MRDIPIQHWPVLVDFLVTGLSAEKNLWRAIELRRKNPKAIVGVILPDPADDTLFMFSPIPEPPCSTHLFQNLGWGDLRFPLKASEAALAEATLHRWMRSSFSRSLPTNPLVVKREDLVDGWLSRLPEGIFCCPSKFFRMAADERSGEVWGPQDLPVRWRRHERVTEPIQHLLVFEIEGSPAVWEGVMLWETRRQEVCWLETNPGETKSRLWVRDWDPYVLNKTELMIEELWRIYPHPLEIRFLGQVSVGG